MTGAPLLDLRKLPFDTLEELYFAAESEMTARVTMLQTLFGADFVAHLGGAKRLLRHPRIDLDKDFLNELPFSLTTIKTLPFGSHSALWGTLPTLGKKEDRRPYFALRIELLKGHTPIAETILAIYKRTLPHDSSRRYDRFLACTAGGKTYVKESSKTVSGLNIEELRILGELLDGKSVPYSPDYKLFQSSGDYIRLYGLSPVASLPYPRAGAGAGAMPSLPSIAEASSTSSSPPPDVASLFGKMFIDNVGVGRILAIPEVDLTEDKTYIDFPSFKDEQIQSLLSGYNALWGKLPTKDGPPRVFLALRLAFLNARGAILATPIHVIYQAGVRYDCCSSSYLLELRKYTHCCFKNWGLDTTDFQNIGKLLAGDTIIVPPDASLLPTAIVKVRLADPLSDDLPVTAASKERTAFAYPPPPDDSVWSILKEFGKGMVDSLFRP